MPGLDFNTSAIQTAESLTARRLERKVEAENSPSARFPDHNRLPYGIYLEWQAMDERPVSGPLVEAARSEGLSFEHIGLTLGTIIHGVDLREPILWWR